MKKIVIFASGSGTNVENIIRFFMFSKNARVTLVMCNNKKAKVFERCKKANVNCVFFDKKDLISSNFVLDIVKKKADYIILAGFLLKIPKKIIDFFPKKIINIHPSLLPKYAGKGMYGMNVHNAVKKNNEKESGITIHYVNEHYDEGAIIFQKKISLSNCDQPNDIAKKIHDLEYEFFPKIIEKVIINE